MRKTGALTPCWMLDMTIIAPASGAGATPSVPSRYQPGVAFPLVLLFHGRGGDENEFLDGKNVKTLAEQRSYSIVAPRGHGASAIIRRWRTADLTLDFSDAPSL